MITFRFHSNPFIQTSDGLAPTLCSPRTKQETGTNPTQQPNKTKVGAIPKMRVGANPTHTTPNQTHGIWVGPNPQKIELTQPKPPNPQIKHMLMYNCRYLKATSLERITKQEENCKLMKVGRMGDND